MKFTNLVHGSTAAPALVTAEGIILLSALEAHRSGMKPLPTCMSELISAGDGMVKELSCLLDTLSSEALASLYLDPAMVTYAPVVTHPGKILCVGLNYKSHTSEIQRDQPETPVLFSKFNNTLAAHLQEIPLPSIAKYFDYEAELVIVMGKEAKAVSESDALSYVYGYCIGNDLTARELQGLTSQWLLGKSLDNFGPVGPYLVTADEVGDPQDLHMCLELNGELRQKAHTSEMIFSCAEIISYASKYITLMPGDIIYTGTTGGVIQGYPREERVWMKPGDEVVIRIDKLGELKNRLI